jgi:Rieske Fe-S protein
MEIKNQNNRTTPPDGRPMDEQPRWRKDFPIDTELDSYVSRRDFTKFITLTSLAFVVGQFWILFQNFYRKRRGALPMTKIAALNEVAIGQTIYFDYPEPHNGCLLKRLDEKTLVAYSQKCTHLSCAVVADSERNCFNCPCHEGVFDCATGRPIAGPPRRPLPRVKIAMRQGSIYAVGLETETI